MTEVTDFGQTHCGKEDAIWVAKAREQMKIKASDTLDKPSRIFSSVVADIPVSCRGILPHGETVKQALWYQRRKNVPKQPTSLQDLSTEGDWATTRGSNP